MITADQIPDEVEDMRVDARANARAALTPAHTGDMREFSPFPNGECATPAQGGEQ